MSGCGGRVRSGRKAQSCSHAPLYTLQLPSASCIRLRGPAPLQQGSMTAHSAQVKASLAPPLAVTAAVVSILGFKGRVTTPLRVEHDYSTRTMTYRLAGSNCWHLTALEGCWRVLPGGASCCLPPLDASLPCCCPSLAASVSLPVRCANAAPMYCAVGLLHSLPCMWCGWSLRVSLRLTDMSFPSPGTASIMTCRRPQLQRAASGAGAAAPWRAADSESSHSLHHGRAGERGPCSGCALRPCTVCCEWT